MSAIDNTSVYDLYVDGAFVKRYQTERGATRAMNNRARTGLVKLVEWVRGSDAAPLPKVGDPLPGRVTISPRKRAVNARYLSDIATDISNDWQNVNYAAAPYLQAMLTLDTIDDRFGADDARSIVLYFLSNARTWRGPVAKEIKAELKAMLKA